MLENALLACPDELWNDRSKQPEFWYLAYHTLFFLDLYLSEGVEGFTPPAPFTLTEMDPAGQLPERLYTKEELQNYLNHGRQKCVGLLETITDQEANRRCGFEWLEMSTAELFLYNLRHVQHHAAQLNLILRQATNAAPGWVRRVRPIPEHS
jgi:hypothetical protein